MEESCPTLKVHEKEMLSSVKEKYLGDVITNDTKMEANIKMRHDKGIGIANGIMSTLKEVSFGVYYFEMGMLFRTTQLLAGILFNTESMCSITENHISKLEDADKYLLRQLFNTCIGTPIEAFYIELSILPVKFIVKGRRMMFYWTMLNKSENEIAKQVFEAQKEFPGKKMDWVRQVKEDFMFCEMDYEESEIKTMKREYFKKIVEEKLKMKAKEYLTALQMKHSKSMYLYQSEKMAEYLRCDQISVKQKKLLFKLRVGTTPNKTNYKKKYENNLHCSLCLDQQSEESLEHLLNCTFLKGKPYLVQHLESIKVNDIYGDLDSQIKAVKVWAKIFRIYENMNKK